MRLVRGSRLITGLIAAFSAGWMDLSPDRRERRPQRIESEGAVVDFGACDDPGNA